MNGNENGLQITHIPTHSRHIKEVRFKHRPWGLSWGNFCPTKLAYNKPVCQQSWSLQRRTGIVDPPKATNPSTNRARRSLT